MILIFKLNRHICDKGTYDQCLKLFNKLLNNIMFFLFLFLHVGVQIAHNFITITGQTAVPI